MSVRISKTDSSEYYLYKCDDCDGNNWSLKSPYIPNSCDFCGAMLLSRDVASQLELDKEYNKSFRDKVDVLLDMAPECEMVYIYSDFSVFSFKELACANIFHDFMYTRKPHFQSLQVGQRDKTVVVINLKHKELK
jgi:hypothetical protein